MDVRRGTAQGAITTVKFEMKLLRGILSKIEVGARRPLLLRRETVAKIGARKRLLFASDLHLRKNGPRHIVDGLLEIASKECPDLVLLGGDLVDTVSGLEALLTLVERLSQGTTVCAVAGNHDRWIGVTRVRDAVVGGSGRWLEDAPWFLTPDCAIYGSREQAVQPASYHLLCTHHPVPSARPFDLTLSGHLHGGQFVFFQREGRLYPGAFLYRWNGLRFDDHEGRTLLISRGVQDTLPFRWNCPREVLMVEI
jgi:predicted MPP superfamily phosphohydrolase